MKQQTSLHAGKMQQAQEFHVAAPWQPFPSEVAGLRDDWMMAIGTWMIGKKTSQEAFDPEFGGDGVAGNSE